MKHIHSDEPNNFTDSIPYLVTKKINLGCQSLSFLEAVKGLFCHYMISHTSFFLGMKADPTPEIQECLYPYMLSGFCAVAKLAF